MGPWGGYITGLAENMEYILTPATIVVGIGGYLGAIFHTPKSWEPAWWVICYSVFVALNIFGVALSFRFSVFIALAALIAQAAQAGITLAPPGTLQRMEQESLGVRLCLGAPATEADLERALIEIRRILEMAEAISFV